MLDVPHPVVSNHGGAVLERRDPCMSIVWIVIVAVAAVALAKRIAWPPERRKSDLGFVSHQWLAERRSSDMSDRQR
jgi:hypothetical protein